MMCSLLEGVETVCSLLERVDVVLGALGVWGAVCTVLQAQVQIQDVKKRVHRPKKSYQSLLRCRRHSHGHVAPRCLYAPVDSPSSRKPILVHYCFDVLVVLFAAIRQVRAERIDRLQIQELWSDCSAEDGTIHPRLKIMRRKLCRIESIEGRNWYFSLSLPTLSLPISYPHEIPLGSPDAA
jgi:hypothetical protein